MVYNTRSLWLLIALPFLLCFLSVLHLLFFWLLGRAHEQHSCHWCHTNTEWQLKSQPSTSNPQKPLAQQFMYVTYVAGQRPPIQHNSRQPPPQQEYKGLGLSDSHDVPPIPPLHSITFSSQWQESDPFFSPLIFLWYSPFESSRTTVLFAWSFQTRKKKSIYYTQSIVNSTASNSSIQQRKTLKKGFDFQSINFSDDISENR